MIVLIFIVIVIILHPPIAIRIGLRKSGLASVIELAHARDGKDHGSHGRAVGLHYGSGEEDVFQMGPI